MEETIKSIVLGLCSGGIYALLAVSYVVIYKSTRVFPFSQAAVLIIGAYIMWYCLIAWHLPIWLGFIITCAGGAILGMFIERAFMRPLVGQPILAPIVVTLCLMLFLAGDRNPDGKRRYSRLWRILLAGRGLAGWVSAPSQDSSLWIYPLRGADRSTDAILRKNKNGSGNEGRP